MAICYEIVYPDLVRQFVQGGSELLTTITNDAWFGTTSAPYQHFAQASMRAIENGRYLVRSANTGISGIVDPYGRVLAQTDDLRAGGASWATARFLDASTIYTRVGDVFAYASVVITLVMLMLARRREYNRTDSDLRWSLALAYQLTRLQLSSQLGDSRHAYRRRVDAPLRGSQQARRRSAELSLKPPARRRN